MTRNALHVKPTITYIAVEGNNSNALDFQLVTYIGLHIKQKDLTYIISEDRGYDPAISMLRNEGNLVYRRKSVTAEYEPLELYIKFYDFPPIAAKKRKYGKSARTKE